MVLPPVRSVVHHVYKLKKILMERCALGCDCITTLRVRERTNRRVS